MAIFIPLFVVMACAAVMTFIKDGIYKDALNTVSTLPDITVQQTAGGRVSYVQEELAKEISADPSLRKVVPRAWGYVPLVVPGGGIASYTLMGVDVGSAFSSQDISLAIGSGRFLSASDKNCAVVGKIFAAQNKVDLGGTILLTDESGNETAFTIIGIFKSSSQIHTADLIVTDIESARTFLGYSRNESSDLAVYLKEPQFADQVSKDILVSRKNVRALTKEDLATAIKQGYDGKAGIFQLAWLILLLSVLVLAWAQASSISLEMKKEIGVLKAIGWSILDIIELKMMEVVIIGLGGILCGILFGMFFVYMGAPLVKQYFLGWAVVYPQFPLPISIEGSSIFLLFVIGLFPLSAATIFPAWLTGTIEPDSAIRSG